MRNIHILRLNAEAHTANFVYIRIANAKSDHRQLKKHIRNYIVWVEECIGQCHWSMFKYQMPGTYCAHIPFTFFFPEKKVLDKYVGRVEWRFLVPRNAPVFGEHSQRHLKALWKTKNCHKKKTFISFCWHWLLLLMLLLRVVWLLWRLFIVSYFIRVCLFTASHYMWTISGSPCLSPLCMLKCIWFAQQQFRTRTSLSSCS